MKLKILFFILSLTLLSCDSFNYAVDEKSRQKKFYRETQSSKEVLDLTGIVLYGHDSSTNQCFVLKGENGISWIPCDTLKKYIKKNNEF